MKIVKKDSLIYENVVCYVKIIKKIKFDYYYYFFTCK